MTQRQSVLIVDDHPENIDVLKNTLEPDYKIKAALNGHRALSIARQKPKPDLILLDVMMPEMDGLTVCKKLKLDPITSDIPVIFITAKSDPEDEQTGIESGAVDYISKPISPPVVKARVRTHLALHQQHQELESLVKVRTNELEETRLQIIRNLGRAAEFKDNETGLHVIRMSHYTRLLAKSLGANKEWVELLYNAAPMHDIGKIGIPDNILLKPGKLDQHEWEIMKSHPQIGADIIGQHQSPLLRLAREVSLCHHEKWDGSGYPNGLKGVEIPLSARVLCIADVFDALTTERPYKKAWKTDDAFDFIQDQAGKHFDPELVRCYLSIKSEILAIKDEYPETH
ncbi:HD domain-containing phosphohydrolase [Methylophaga sp.]|uniref:response regulator n=1 Tax=Methylophaga sp. TaxID=2024840 RepID=UPI003F699F0C